MAVLGSYVGTLGVVRILAGIPAPCRCQAGAHKVWMRRWMDGLGR